MLKARSGGQILVDTLVQQGTDLVFGVPGESYLDVLDALHDAPIEFIVNRQEGGAAFMAEAYGKMTGRPGICFVTRGPGATNASIGVHTAHQDSTPMILFIGQVGNDFIEREAFQEIDYRRMFGQMAKWVAQIDRADRIPEYVARAYQIAVSGRPGPVVLALPEDMLTSKAEVANARSFQAVQAAPAPEQIKQLAELLANAKRPVVLLGGGGWTLEACAKLQTFVERHHLPTACTFRFQDLFDNRHPNYIGDVGIGINPALAKRIEQSDLILAIGPRLGEMTTGGYTLLQAPIPNQKLVHIHTGAEELGRVYQADLMINSGMPQIASALANIGDLPFSGNGYPWRESVSEARKELEKWQQEPPIFSDGKAKLNLWKLVQTLQAKLPEDTILTNGAGNFATWGHRFWKYGSKASGLRTQLAPTSGAMGYGVPAAVAARIIEQKRGVPRTVLNFAGDGDFMMNGQELATAVQFRAPVLFIVFNNGVYGTIRMHQEKHYPARVSGTQLHNPDFAALARAYGAFGQRAETDTEFETALSQAIEHMHRSNLPALIELRYDAFYITPNASLDAIRKAAQDSKK